MAFGVPQGLLEGPASLHRCALIGEVAARLGVVAQADLRAAVDFEGSVQGGPQPLQVVWLQQARAAAPQMQARQARPPRKPLLPQADFADERRDIGAHRVIAQRLLGVAAAEPAQAVAIWNVDIKGKIHLLFLFTHFI